MKMTLTMITFLFLIVTSVSAQKMSPMEFWNTNQPEEENVTPLFELAAVLKQKISEGRVDWTIDTELEKIYFSYTAQVNDEEVNCAIAFTNFKNTKNVNIRTGNVIYTTFLLQEKEEQEIFQDLIDYVLMLDKKGITKDKLKKLHSTIQSLNNTPATTKPQ